MPLSELNKTLMKIIAGILGVVFLPASTWLFLIVMDTRDTVQEMKADIYVIREIAVKEMAKLNAANEIFMREISSLREENWKLKTRMSGSSQDPFPTPTGDPE